MIEHPTVLLTEKQASEILNLSPRTLSHWRYIGNGPKYVRISHRCIRYRSEDLQVFLDSLVRENPFRPKKEIQPTEMNWNWIYEKVFESVIKIFVNSLIQLFLQHILSF